MAPKWVPKRIKNRSKNMMDFLFDSKAVLESPTSGQPPEVERADSANRRRGRRHHTLFVCGRRTRFVCGLVGSLVATQLADQGTELRDDVLAVKFCF